MKSGLRPQHLFQLATVQNDGARRRSPRTAWPPRAPQSDEPLAPPSDHPRTPSCPRPRRSCKRRAKSTLKKARFCQRRILCRSQVCCPCSLRSCDQLYINQSDEERRRLKALGSRGKAKRAGKRSCREGGKRRLGSKLSFARLCGRHGGFAAAGPGDCRASPLAAQAAAQSSRPNLCYPPSDPECLARRPRFF